MNILKREFTEGACVEPVELTTDDRGDNFKSIERSFINGRKDLSNPVTKQLYDWWTSFEPFPPSRQDLDISDIPKLAAHIYLIEVLSPTRFLYRLCGENVAQLVGKRYRLREISCDSPIPEDRIFADYLSVLYNQRGLSRCRGSLEFFDLDMVQFESLDCPLIDQNDQLTHFVGVMAEIK